MQLSTQAGWNQRRTDWELLVALAPNRCFAGRIDDTLVATTTVITYDGDVSWIGMVLVDEEYRGQGYGSRMFRTALEATLENGPSAIGLDATHLGRNLYSKNDFVEIVPITRWRGSLESTTTTDDVTELESTESDLVCSFDRCAVDVDRGELLDRLLALDGVTGLVYECEDDLYGYAVLRPGRQHWQLGPVVAETSAVYAQLLSAAAEELNSESVIVDSPMDDCDDEILSRSGLTPERRLSRMTHTEPRPLLLDENVKAIVGLEWG